MRPVMVLIIAGAIVGVKLTRSGSRSSVDPTPATPVVIEPDEDYTDDDSTEAAEDDESGI